MNRWTSILLLTVSSARAHPTALFDSRLAAETWSFEPGVLFGLAVVAIFYWLGLAELKEAGVWGRAFKRWQGAAFLCGWVTLSLALVSPLHAMGQVLFSAHMVQHEVLMIVAAPLLVLGRPIPVFMKALPPATRRMLLRFGHCSVPRRCGAFLTLPVVAWIIHLLALWIWHLPSLFAETVSNAFTHAVQHLTFLGSALLFWWAILDGGRKALGYGAAVLYVFGTALHSGILGAMLTFARHPWYTPYLDTARAWGLSPLEDQQLGGLIMWIPASLTYIVAGLAFFARWLKESELRVTNPTFQLEQPIT